MLVRKWSNIIDMALRHNHAKIQAKQPSFDIILSRKMPLNWHFQAFFGSYSLLSQDSSFKNARKRVLGAKTNMYQSFSTQRCNLTSSKSRKKSLNAVKIAF